MSGGQATSVSRSLRVQRNLAGKKERWNGGQKQEQEHMKGFYLWSLWIALLSLRHEYTEKRVVKEGRKEEEEEEQKENQGSSFEISSHRPQFFPLPWSWFKFPQGFCVVLVWGRVPSILLDFHKGTSPKCTWMSINVPSATKAVAKALSHFGLCMPDPSLLHFSATNHKVFSIPHSSWRKLSASKERLRGWTQ